MSRRRAVASVALLAAALALPMVSANATSNFSFSGDGAGRFAGTNRFDTARLIAGSAGFGQVDSVVIATGRNFPDALAGNYLAGAYQSPILLTERTSVPAETLNALSQVAKPKTITLLGGTAAIDASVENDLRGRGYTVDRVQGLDRYGTALAVARKTQPLAGVGTIAGKRTAFLATGLGFADALAAGPAAFNKKLPVFLTTPNSLSTEASTGLSELGIEHVVILGGTAAVSTTVETQVKAALPSATVERVSGTDRTATATALADWAITKAGFEIDHVNLARGDEFADALAGGPHGGREKAPTLLAASPTALDTPANANSTWLDTNKATLETGHIFGGTGAVSQAVADAAAAAAGQAPPEAASGTSTPVVKRIVPAEDYFVSTADRTYRYDTGDTFRRAGQTVANLADFEKMLSVGDALNVTYNPGGVSIFDLTGDQVAATAKPSATGAPNKSITVTATLPTANNSFTTYALQRAKHQVGCQSLAPLSFTTQTASFTGAYTDSALADGCYVYRVVSVQPAPVAGNATNTTTATSPESDPISVPAPTAPTFTSTTTTDTNLPDVVSVGDVHTFVFDTIMASSVSAAGSSYRLSDGDGTVADVVCGTNATCQTSVTNQNNQPVTQMTVTLTAAPTVVSAGSVTGESYPAQLIAIGSGWTDGNGVKATFAGSDVVLE